MSDRRLAIVAGAVALILVGVGCSVSSGDPTDAKSIRFTVSYADESTHRTVTVRFGLEGQLPTRMDVTTPWRSQPITVRKGSRYTVTSKGPAIDNMSSVCGVEASNGWTGANSSPGGSCKYTFPDDAAG